MSISLSDHFSYKRLIRFVLPTVGMMIVTSVYSIVDGFFVSNFSGKNSFAAINLVMPVLMALASFGFMIGTGGSALVAKSLGESNKEKANRYFSMLIYVLIFSGIILSVIGIVFMRQIAVALGATEVIIEDCVLYGRILLAANTFYMLLNAFQSLFVTAEKPKLGLIVTISAGLCNVLLDFLLVYILRTGLLGAAIATAVSQIIGGSAGLIYFSRKNKSLLRLCKTKIEFKALLQACANGSSEMVTNLSMSVVGILYNIQLLKIAAENGVAAYGVIMYVSFVFMSFFIGFSIGTAPIISYHYGADNTPEIKSLFKKCMIIIAATGTVLGALGILLARPLSFIFVGYDAELFDMTSNGMSLYSLSFLLGGFNVFSSSLFTALNDGKVSAFISFMRTLVLQVASVYLLPIILGLDGIWLAVVAAEGLTIIITLIMLIVNRKKYHYV